MDRSGCTLAIHTLPDWVDENYLYQLFMPTKAVVSVKVSRLRTAGGGKVAYMTMNSHENAEGCLQAYNGTMPPNVQLRLEMSWATDVLPKFEEYSAFIGDLAQSVTDTELLHLFQGHYPSAFEARVVSDVTTGHPKGFGFVRFSDEGQRDRAIQEMHGSLLHGRALRVSIAAKRSATGAASERSAFSQGVSEGDFDKSNTTLFIGGLSSSVTEAALSQLFQPFGGLTYVRVPPNKGCGFVQFHAREAAESALARLQGHTMHGSTLRLSWGRNAAKHSKAGWQGYGGVEVGAQQGGYAAPVAEGYNGPEAWGAYMSGYYVGSALGAAPEHGGAWQEYAGKEVATEAHGVGFRAALSQFGVEEPTNSDVNEANSRFMRLVPVPPLLTRWARPPAYHVLRAGVSTPG